MAPHNGKQVGVLLAGAGVYDGSELQEAVFTLWALAKGGATAVCMAPDKDQLHVVDHRAGEPAEGESRNVLTEAARIARGDIRDVADVKADELDALIVPGGYGAAKNLCTFAIDGPAGKADPTVAALITALADAKKPLGFLCIAPALAALVLGDRKPKLTIGNDADTAAALTSLGVVHVDCAVQDIVVDEEQRIVSTPAYMLGQNPAEVAIGIERCVQQVLTMLDG